MGAFILMDNKEIRSDLALELFREMGFSAPKCIEIGNMFLYVYSKMIGGVDNTFSDGDYTIVSIGAPIYKGQDYKNSLSLMLKDYKSCDISFDQLRGQYTVLFCHDDKIEILRDQLGSKHIFTDNNFNVFSSHMLPICQCIDGQLHINRMAFYEKFLTGFIMSPDTLFEEILQIDNRVAKTINNAKVNISFMATTGVSISEKRKTTYFKCLREQAEALQSYFGTIKNYSKRGVDIGLSGGYDSRLVLACLNQYTKRKIHLHSHSTENVHKNDLTIAKQMAEYIGEPCHVVQTKKLNHCENIDDILRKSVLYFDGRSSFSIGGCGEVYTALYRISSTESIPFTLTGVGGELFRNVFDIGRKKISIEWLLKNKVFSSSFRESIDSELFSRVGNMIIDKVASRLSIDKKEKQTKVIAHRYYCEIMMPDGQGVALDAYNQVSCCIAPFLEPSIITKGYEAVRLHSSGGEFEGKLIDYIDSGLAAIPSSYGYPIGNRPIKAKIKESIRTYIPSSLWNKLSMFIHNKNNICESTRMKEIYANSNTLKEAYSYMVGLFPEIDFEFMIQNGEEIRKIQFMAMTLYYLRERINIQ